jgi:hypothetical protein
MGQAGYDQLKELCEDFDNRPGKALRHAASL